METQELPTKLSDGFFQAFCPDPTIMYDLGELYDGLNQKFFGGELPTLVKTKNGSYNRVKWDGRMGSKTLGTYTPVSKKGWGTIRLSRKIAGDPVRLKSVLVHEMVHQFLDLKDLDDGLKGHGENFINLAREINLTCKDNNLLYRVHFFDKEITEEKPVFFSDLVKSEIFCVKDLDFARTVEKTIKTVFHEGYSFKI